MGGLATPVPRVGDEDERVGVRSELGSIAVETSHRVAAGITTTFQGYIFFGVVNLDLTVDHRRVLAACDARCAWLHARGAPSSSDYRWQRLRAGSAAPLAQGSFERGADVAVIFPVLFLEPPCPYQRLAQRGER